MPFTTKAELVADQAAHPPFGSNLTYPLERYTRFCQTSGTTARPLAILDTPESWEWMLGNWARIYRGRRICAPATAFTSRFPLDRSSAFGRPLKPRRRCGLLCLPGGGLSSAARLRAIVEHEATVLCCTPTYALHLAEARGGKASICGRGDPAKSSSPGEPGGSVPAVRARIRAAWDGAEVLDHYGMTEVGPVAFQRPGEDGLLHIIEDVVSRGSHRSRRQARRSLPAKSANSC